MAGATNRAMKAAGVPKATIATLRVEHGGHLSLRSAISIAHERGLDTGKAHEFMAKRDAKAETKRQAAQATAKAAQQGNVARSLGDAGKGMLAQRKAAAERVAALRAASAQRQAKVAGSVAAASKAMLAARKAGAKPSFDGAMGKFKAHAQKQIDDYYAANFPNSKTKPTLHYSDGEKYIRVTKVEPGQKTGSAHSFIDKATGDVLKPDGFKRPAKGARGNIFSGDFGVNEHGANYSAAYMKRRFATDFNAPPSKGGPSKQAIADARDVIMGPRKGAAKPALAGARPFNAERHLAKANAVLTKREDNAKQAQKQLSGLLAAKAPARDIAAAYTAQKRAAAAQDKAFDRYASAKERADTAKEARATVQAAPKFKGAGPFNADRHKARAMALSDARKSQLKAADARLQAAKTPDERQSANKAMMRAQDAVDRAGALNRGAAAKAGARDRAALVAKARNAAKAKARAALPAMTAQIGKTISASRAAMSAAPAPKKGTENILRTDDGKQFVHSVKPLHQKGDFFVHKGIGGGYSVTHRTTGLSVGSSNYLSTARGMMEGLSKTGSKVLSRIQSGDTKAAAAFQRYTNMTRKARYGTAAATKYYDGK